MYYRIVTLGRADEIGLVIGQDASRSTASVAMHRNRRLYDAVEIVEREAGALEVDRCYPEIVQQIEAEKREWVGLEILKAWFRAQAGDTSRECRTETIAGKLELWGWELSDLEQQLGDKARQILADEHAERQQHAEKMTRIDAVNHQLSLIVSDARYTCTAQSGIQGGEVYYSAQIPLRDLVQLEFADHNQLPAETRAQRLLDRNRGEGVKQYILDNPKGWILPSLVVTCDSQMQFKSGTTGDSGQLSIPASARLVLTDGQHREYGIARALKMVSASHAARLMNETINVLFYFDLGLERLKQRFADINCNHVKTSTAIGILNNLRNPLNRWLLELMDQLPEVSAKIELDKNSVGKNSDKLWSLTSFRSVALSVIGVTQARFENLDQAKQDKAADVVKGFFTALIHHLPAFADLFQCSTRSLVRIRDQDLIAQAVMLQAIAIAARHYRDQRSLDDWQFLQGLTELDLKRQARCWQGRCMTLGKIDRTATATKATAAVILQALGGTLPADLAALDQRVQGALQAA